MQGLADVKTLYWWRKTPATRRAPERWDRVPYLAPEVGARPAVDGEVPRGALSVRRTAQGAGWVVVATYARGWLSHVSTGAPLRVVDSLALRMRHPDGRRAVAVWHDGRFDLAYRILPTLAKLGGVKDLMSFLTQRTEVPEECHANTIR